MTFTLTQYLESSTARQRELVRGVTPDFDEIFVFSKRRGRPVECVHRSTGLTFMFVPGGRHYTGFDTSEIQLLSQIKHMDESFLSQLPRRVEVDVPPFFMMRDPLTVDKLPATITPPANEEGEHGAAFLSVESVRDVCRLHALRLPTAAEWEFAVRGGQSSLYPFGNELPSASALQTWMALSFPEDGDAARTLLGFRGVFVGEWCVDDAGGATPGTAGNGNRGYTIKGGAARFWPWQAEEWIFCLSGFRMSPDGLIDGTAGMRLAVSALELKCRPEPRAPQV